LGKSGALKGAETRTVSISECRAEFGRRCGVCAYFRNDPAYLEAALPGLTSLSSAGISARSDDGLCTKHERYLSARASCADFTPIR